MEFREALDALEARLKLLRVTVIPHPPRDLPASKTIFFAAIRKGRVTQDGGDEIRLTIIATTSSQTDGKFDELEEITDDIDAVIDANDIDGVDWTTGDSEWDMGVIEVAGSQFFGARVDVTVHY